ncbi:predicted protein [Chaetoceros tenuissimus]|uniref:Uncharacterized protein n=1 Tax=Chaetoceros tenuissimus TaxID=426638 RepID=A0AAD3CKH5_9STRA|nr:predicted protein [Chaetoceros tenuissimus]
MKSFKRLLAIHVLLFSLVEISIAAKSSLRNTRDEENNEDNTHRLGENLDAKEGEHSSISGNRRLANGHNIFSPENKVKYSPNFLEKEKGQCPICSETGKECRGTCITTGNPANIGCFECIGYILEDYGNGPVFRCETPSRYYVVKSVDEKFLYHYNVYEMLRSGDVISYLMLQI